MFDFHIFSRKMPLAGVLFFIVFPRYRNSGMFHDVGMTLYDSYCTALFPYRGFAEQGRPCLWPLLIAGLPVWGRPSPTSISQADLVQEADGDSLVVGGRVLYSVLVFRSFCIYWYDTIILYRRCSSYTTVVSSSSYLFARID